MTLSTAPAAVAVPTAEDVFTSAVHKPTTEARVFCYNSDTGRFLHWGHAAGIGIRTIIGAAIIITNTTGIAMTGTGTTITEV